MGSSRQIHYIVNSDAWLSTYARGHALARLPSLSPPQSLWGLYSQTAEGYSDLKRWLPGSGSRARGQRYFQNLGLIGGCLLNCPTAVNSFHLCTTSPPFPAGSRGHRGCPVLSSAVTERKPKRKCLCCRSRGCLLPHHSRKTGYNGSCNGSRTGTEAESSPEAPWWPARPPRCGQSLPPVLAFGATSPWSPSSSSRVDHLS